MSYVSGCSQLYADTKPVNQLAYSSDSFGWRLRSSRKPLQVLVPRPRTLKRFFASAEPASFVASTQSQRNAVVPTRIRFQIILFSCPRVTVAARRLPAIAYPEGGAVYRITEALDKA